MKTLTLHIPGLYDKLQKLQIKSSSSKRQGNKIRETALSETYAVTETFLTTAHEVLLADYRLDILTILYNQQPPFDSNDGIVQQLKKQGIHYLPLESSLFLERRVQEKT